MSIDPKFNFYGVRKLAPEGEHITVIKDFETVERISKAGNTYYALQMLVDIEGDEYKVNLSLNPKEEGTLKKLISQISKQTKKKEEDIVELCSNPQDFFNFAKGKKTKLVSTEKGYLDIFPRKEDVEHGEDVNPDDIPF